MALRNIRKIGDEILEKRAREIKEDSERLQELISDMFETMYAADGVGLAAPQVGILKRLFVVDCSEDKTGALVFINPEILETAGEQTGSEGCLSYPGMCGIVTRPDYVKAKALNREFKEFVIEAEGLLARAILHENDHLNGVMYTDKVIGEVYESGNEEAERKAALEAGLEVVEE